MATNITSDQFKARTDLAKKQIARWNKPTQFKTWTTVTKTWFAEKTRKETEARSARTEKKRQKCISEGWTFNPVAETCSMWITEDLWVRSTWNLEKDIALWLSARWTRVSPEQEALNLIARWDIAQVEEWDISWLSETALATLAWAKKQEEEKTELEKKLEKAKLDAEKKRKLKEKALEAAAPWIEVWAEAPTVALARWIEWIQTERAAIIEEEFAFNQQAISDAKTELDEALRTWRVDLVKQARASMLDLRKQELNLKSQATSDVLETMWDTLLGKTEDELAQIAMDQNVDFWLLKLQQEKLQLKDATAEAKTQVATQKQAQWFVKGLNNDQLWALTSAQATQLNTEAWLPEWTLSNWVLRAQEINKLDKSEQELANAKLQADIDKKNAETLTELGKDEDEIKVTPTWVQEEVTMTDWRTINIDSVWKESLMNINEELWDEWLRLGAVATSWARSIEQQQRLYGQWRTREELEAMWINWDFAQQNKPVVTDADWVKSKSLHQTWLAIDLFPDKEYIEKVRPNLEANWWFQNPDLVDKWDVWHFEYKWIGADPEITQFDIANFNNSTFKPQKDLKTKADKARYSKFLSKRKDVLWNPDPLLIDILEISEWWKDLTDSAITKLDKFWWVLSWAWDLLQTIEEVNKDSLFWWTWPISWAIASINPYNTSAQVLKRQLIALIPWLARWVYWEVWVLTDNDVRLYASTLPNLTQTEDVNKAVLWITLRTIQRSYQNSLKTQAAAWRDVSWFAWAYEAIEQQVKSIEEELWMTENAIRLEAEELANKFDPELSSVMNKYNLK